MKGNLKFWGAFVGIAVLAATASLTGCGGGSNSQPAQNLNAALSVAIGDAPADRVVSFELTVNSLSLTRSDGSTVTVLSTPRKLELTHLSATVEPVSFLSVPAGTYNSATVSFSNPEVTFVAANGTIVNKEPGTSGTVTFQLSPAVTIGAGASVLSIDIDAANSISIDLTSNAVTVSPAFKLLASASIPQNELEAEKEVEAEQGEMRDMVGQVSAKSGTTFTITAGQSGVSLTFDTNSGTEFQDGLANLGSVTVGMIVKVEGITRPDGTLLAKEVEGVANEAAEAEGLVVSVISPTQFTMVAHDGVGSGLSPAAVGSTITVNLSNPNFSIGAKKVNLNGLPFQPTFTSVNPGQRVEADTDAPVVGAVIAANKVKLLEQALSGVVSNASSNSFTLTPSAESAFRLITGATSLTVFTQSNTQMKITPANGSTVRARGLLFVDGGAYKMVAIRIAP